MEPIENIFQLATFSFDSIKDPNKICLNLTNDRGPVKFSWTNYNPIKYNENI